MKVKQITPIREEELLIPPGSKVVSYYYLTGENDLHLGSVAVYEVLEDYRESFLGEMTDDYGSVEFASYVGKMVNGHYLVVSLVV